MADGGVVLDNLTQPRNHASTLDGIVQAQKVQAQATSFQTAYNGFSAADKLKIDAVLALFSVNLADGNLSQSDIDGLANNGVLFDNLNNPRDHQATLKFYVEAKNFQSAYNALSASD